MIREDGRRLKSPASFFNIILPSTLADNKLRIPEKFVDAHGDDLLTVITLIIPDGCSWKVGLKKAEGMLWFSDGWQNLVDNYSISPGDFLIFKYQGRSTFTLFIYDVTSTEIHYSSRTLPSSSAPKHYPQWPVSDEEDMDKDDSLEILESNGPLGNLASPIIGIGSARCGLASYETHKSKDCCYTSNKRYLFEDEKVTSTSTECINGENSLTKNGASTSEPSQKFREPRAVVEPAGDNGLQSNSCEFVNLENNVGKTKLHHRMGADAQEEIPRKRHKVQYGQSRHSVIEDGIDLISPRVANGKHNSGWEWSVVKSEDEEASNLGIRSCFLEFLTTMKLTSQERANALHAARMFTSQNPSFVVIIRQMCLTPTSLLSMPGSFCESYIRGPGIKVELEVGDERWPVYTIRRTSRCFTLSRGWAAFANKNRLSLGDICVFELVDIEEMVLRVSIFRASEDVNKQVFPYQRST